MGKGFFLISAAMALAAVTSTSAIAAAPAKLRLPPPKAPQNQIYSPGRIAQDLEKRGYRIESMKRMGTTYSVTAIGPSKSKVQMTIDGRSGEIIGLAVLQAAPNLASVIAAIIRGGTGARYVDDWHPFGIIIPDTYQTRWTTYPVGSWTYTTAYVPEAWSGKGYRFAVPYRSVRPGHGGKSRSKFPASKMRKPAYDVYDSNGTEITTEYSEEMTEITETTTYETTYASEDEALEESYLGGAVGDDDFDMEDIADYDSEDGDFDFADNANDGYDADLDEGDDGDDGSQGTAMSGDDDDDDQDADASDNDDDGDDDMDASSDDDQDDDPDMDEPDDGRDDGDMDEGDEYGADEGDDDDGDYDDGGDDDDYDDGGDDGGDDEPDLNYAIAA